MFGSGKYDEFAYSNSNETAHIKTFDHKGLRSAINTLCHFLFCSHKTHWAPIIFDATIDSDSNVWRYSLEGILVPDTELIDLAKTLLLFIKDNDDFNEYDCHGYVYKIYFEPIQTILNTIN